MSDGKILVAIEQMEGWLADPSWEPDPEALDQWNKEFQAALPMARLAADWSDLRGRAHEAGRLLEARIAVVAEERDQMRAELGAQELGNRALRGYGAGLR